MFTEPGRRFQLVSFRGSILMLVDDALACAVDLARRTFHPVDLAGSGRHLIGDGAVDPETGELHLVTSAASLPQLHVRVSPGGLTRTTRPIDGAPGAVNEVALTADQVVFRAGEFLGVMDRTGVDVTTEWMPHGNPPT